MYSRIHFNLASPSSLSTLLLGVDYDDGFVAWVNGVEVLRSGNMFVGAPAWNTSPTGDHESSNGLEPVYGFQDITAAAMPVLRAGDNL